jgi:hypothetical protein
VQTFLLLGKRVAGPDVRAIIAPDPGVLSQNRLPVTKVILFGVAAVTAVAADFAIDVFAVTFVFVGIKLDRDAIGLVDAFVLHIG